MHPRKLLRTVLLIVLGIWSLGPGWHLDHSVKENARRYTRPIEFDYVDWTLETLWIKTMSPGRVDPKTPGAFDFVEGYLKLVGDIQELQGKINEIYANPDLPDPHVAATPFEVALTNKMNELTKILPPVESVLQEQVHQALSAKGISGKLPIFPPVLYHSSEVPLSLLISARDEIALIGNISIRPSLSVEEIVQLEYQVSSGLDLSVLIEPIGGIGTYPTMIMLTTDLNWLVETIAHEWTHNYLSLHSLGIHYESSPELRSMNETVANLVGKEIGQEVIRTFYPELVPQTISPLDLLPISFLKNTTFDFQFEMRTTRVEVDRLLAAGKIEEAESYMEIRRQVFWEHGYLIRRINQAYFAFYGAYNDVPGGGSAGDDPVGPAVVQFRAQFADLGDFLHAIAKMGSFEDLQYSLATIQD